MEKVKLPRYDWFMGSYELDGRTNYFTGSLRADQYSPTTSSCSLHYKITVEKQQDETLILNVVSYMTGRYPDFKNSYEETTQYEFTVEGILKAEEFLNQKYKEICRRDILGENI